MKTTINSTLQAFIIFFAVANGALNPAFAQNGVGGGDPTAADFQNFINELDTYLLSDEGKAEFPELKQPEFHNVIIQVKPVVKDERVYDSFGVEQACVSHAEEGNRYFQCDLKRLPRIELNNQPTFYRITFHELLFQVGLELPISKDIPSDFKISSRLKLYLKTFQKWVPGVSHGTEKDVGKTYFEHLVDLYNAGTVPDYSKLVKIARAGRCFSDVDPNYSTPAMVMFVSMAQSDAGPISTEKYQLFFLNQSLEGKMGGLVFGPAAHYEDIGFSSLNPNFFDNISFAQALDLGFWKQRYQASRNRADRFFKSGVYWRFLDVTSKNGIPGVYGQVTWANNLTDTVAISFKASGKFLIEENVFRVIDNNIRLKLGSDKAVIKKRTFMCYYFLPEYN